MTKQEWLDSVRRLKNPLTVMPPTVRRDVATVLKVIAAIDKQLSQANGEIEGLRMTLVVLTKRLGTLDVDFDDVEALKPNEHLVVADLDADGKRIKRFAYSDAPPENLDPVVHEGPKLVQ